MHGALQIYANRQRVSKVQLQILQALGPPAGQVEGMHMIRHVHVSSNPHISIIPGHATSCMRRVFIPLHCR